MILKPPYSYRRVKDLIPNRDVFRIFDLEGTNIGVAWTEDNAVGIVTALDTVAEATRLTIENAELKAQIEKLLLD